MKCSRCAAELPDSSTFCSRCGAASPSGQLVTSGFSYLPVGAPPWPASAPGGRYAYGANAAAPVLEATPQLTEKAGRSSVRTILTVALILLIALLVGVGGTLGVLASEGRLSPGAATTKKAVVQVPQTQATPGSTPTAATQGNQLPTPTSFKLTSVKDVNAALEYPTGWVQDALQKSTDGTSLGIHSPDAQQIGISFFLMRFSDSTSATISSPDQINQSNVQGFSQLSGVSNMQTVPSSGTAPTIGGTNWMELDATFLNSSSVKMDLVTISVEHSKVYYNIAVLAPDAYYTEAMQKYIQHMFTTFKFLS
jgi:hypothetical protein